MNKKNRNKKQKRPEPRDRHDMDLLVREKNPSRLRFVFGDELERVVFGEMNLSRLADEVGFDGLFSTHAEIRDDQIGDCLALFEDVKVLEKKLKKFLRIR